jgi:adenosylcobinamide kinase/adenosylcobinamide-phosphate guanylyltransferase
MSNSRPVLVLGGARSGKSAVAEAVVAGAGGNVTYLATGWPPDPATDPAWADRVAVHRSRRPPDWRTVEVRTDLPVILASTDGPVLVDSLGTWVAGAPGFAVDGPALCAALAARPATTVLVSDEVGLGVHPETADGLAFRDALGDLNQAVAEVAGEVLLVVAGRVLAL